VQQSRHAAQAAAFLYSIQPTSPTRIIAKPCIFFGNESATLKLGYTMVDTDKARKICIGQFERNIEQVVDD
jgi:hypothetical protein